ncbi:MAG: TRAM domain-containing protein, partial [Sphingomonadaceae bacterium]|nr:TRAM domain-containing protein [Sphingomonadaceae bacterium]
MENPTITIDDVAFGGDGVGRMADGRVVFVPYTTVGDRVRVKVTRSKKRFVRAEIEAVLESAPTRVTPPCPFYTRCVGCQYQHIDPAEVIDLKAKQLRGLLQRVGSLGEIPDIDPIVASPSSYGYRNKLKVHKTQHGFGFYGADNKTVVPITSCAIAAPAIGAALANLDAAGDTLTLRLDADGTVHKFTDKDSAATRIT